MQTINSSTLIEPIDSRINRRFFERIFALSRPYWTRQGAWRSWLVLAACIAYTLGETALGAKISFLTREFNNALVTKQTQQYWHVFAHTTLLGLLAFGGIAGFFQGYVIQRLALHWRLWMTKYLVRRYLSSLTYFRIEQDNDVDNVDQRIQQETAPFCEMVTYLPGNIIGALAHVSVQGWILLAIEPTLFYGVLVYGALTAALTWILNVPFIRLNFQSTAAEADLRYGLLHIRTNAETVALYGGEFAEEASVNSRLQRAIRIALATMRYQFIMGAAESGFGIAWTLLPVLVLA